MRTAISGSSLLVIVLTLSACDVSVTTAGNQSTQTEKIAPQSAPAAAVQGGWSAATVSQLRKAINARGAHGLDGVQFPVNGTPGPGEAALTSSALRYAYALSRGITDPTKLYDIYTVPRPNEDLYRGLTVALASGKVDAWIEGLAPQDANYRKLSAAYVALRGKQQARASVIPDSGNAIKPGSKDSRVPAIAQQLVAFGYLDKTLSLGDRLTPAMTKAVKTMQTDYGIKPDGAIGSDALAILNLSDIDRARAIAVDMERLRWLDRNAPATRIDVNLAAARLSYWRDGKLANVRKVVVGEPDKETPQLGSPIFRLVANPTWTVPRSVQQKEMTGKGVEYFQKNNLAWKNGWIVQQAGPKNSLGLVKFDMKNEHAIYLHDTPAKQLFAQVQRQRSHGCVRVDDALGFAEMLAQDEGVIDKWHQARAGKPESFVSLPHEIPVRMLYQTVLFDDSGKPIVRSDPYGWNDRIAIALGLGSSTSYRLKTNDADVGP